MDREANKSQINVLGRMLLDKNTEPMDLPLSLLKDITNGFSPDHRIGIGGFAVVYKGVVGNGMVAVKKLSNTFSVPENKFHEEVRNLIKAKHKNIVRFLGYCADMQGKMEEYEGNLVMTDQRNWLLCFEYVCNGGLDKHITDATCGLNWMERYRIIRGISEGLLFLHEKRILHLDLKPANILLDGHMVPKIADFGLSRCLGEEQTRAITTNLYGTLGYMDPEYLRSGQISFASDIYSLGVVIIEILTGMRQYLEDEHVVQNWMIRLKVSDGDMQLEQVRVCYKIAIECMHLDPKKRPVARDIVSMLDETASVGCSDEISIGNSLFEPHVSLPREESGERIGELAAENLQVDVEEGQQKVDQLPLQGVQDTNKQNVNSRGTSISSSISNVFYKLTNLDIFNRKDDKLQKNKKKNRKDDMRTLLESHNVKIFRKEELEPIIRRNKLIGKGTFAEVYMGIVRNTPVAVKIPIHGSLLERELFENQVINMSQLNHKNIVRLIGCCQEVDHPMLVYELVSNGRSLDHILHWYDKVPINLDVRLTIAAESAQGLAYLHSQARTKIWHGHVKPSNILLDENFMPKIAGFGMSRLITGDKEYTERVMGDMDYMDPEYLQEGRLTLKSDVYSFGIVILELISRKEPCHSDKKSLVRSFLEVHKEGKKATELFDKEIAVTAADLEILVYLAEIAMECIDLDVDKRPAMTDVAERLLLLNRSRRSKVICQ